MNDEHIERLRQRIAKDIGLGCPDDKKTIATFAIAAMDKRDQYRQRVGKLENILREIHQHADGSNDNDLARIEELVQEGLKGKQ